MGRGQGAWVSCPFAIVQGVLYNRCHNAGRPAVDPGGNLGAAGKPGFSPDPDDASLQLLRTAGPLEAAERVAAYLAGQKDLSGTVIIGADSVLDAESRQRLADAILQLQTAAGFDQLLLVSHDDSFEGKIEHTILMQKTAASGSYAEIIS